jgi:hypothetical protein
LCVTCPHVMVAQARIDEVIESALSHEREATIARLHEALAAREVDFRALQR